MSGKLVKKSGRPSVHWLGFHANLGRPPKFVKMSNFLNQKTYAQATKNQPVAKELSLFEQTIQPVKDQKLPYDNERETEGDGNCFYNAIIDQKENALLPPDWQMYPILNLQYLLSKYQHMYVHFVSFQTLFLASVRGFDV